jgi:hypothetical protein
MADSNITLNLDPLAMHCLVNALEDLMAAREKTDHGFVADYCDNAIKEVKNALRLYVGAK